MYKKIKTFECETTMVRCYKSYPNTNRWTFCDNEI